MPLYERRFACVGDAINESVTSLLRAACERRGVAYTEVPAATFAFDPATRLGPGDLMYRPAASTAALRVEQFLYGPGVGTFYRGDDDRPFFVGITQPFMFERAGLCVPPTIYCGSADRALLATWAERLGGYPLLAKMGGQGGRGVVILESYRALCSFVDHALQLRHEPMLTAFIENARHWRVMVVGERAVAAYRCKAEPGDFRACTPDDAFTTEPPLPVGAIAIAAVRATRLEFGGVDVLECDDRCYVLESNFPCYFPHAELLAGIDVSGAMVEHLIRKANARAAAHHTLMRP
jgi:RimK-like ATP-grasp domain